jgi:sugar phosphate isomerase/epimerase
MLVGLMNDPGRPPEEEVARIAETGFEFVDLTLGPPSAWPGDGRRLGRLLGELGLSAVGHTAYLPIASPFPELRAQAHSLFTRALETFADAGIGIVNIHPDPTTRLIPIDVVRTMNAEAIAELADRAEEYGVRLMVENLGASFSRPADLHEIFNAAPSVGFHLDVGHANIALGAGEANRTGELLSAFGRRLAHVHVHDNVGREDLHLPLGAGTIDWPVIVGLLKQAEWNGTVTIEVFANQDEYVHVSRRLWKTWWETPDAAGSEPNSEIRATGPNEGTREADVRPRARSSRSAG